MVDDAIVVGENIFAHQEMDKSSSIAAIDGATEVSSPGEQYSYKLRTFSALRITCVFIE